MINPHSTAATIGAAIVAGLAAAAVFGMPSASADPIQKLDSFGTGHVTIDGDSATVVNDAAEYGGVYLDSPSLTNKPLRAVDLSFASTGDATGGAPRFSIPIDVDRDRAADSWAFIDVLNCAGTPGGTTTVSTDNPDCAIYYGTESMPYENWDAFAAANPTYRIASDAAAFIIADQPGEYSITNVDLR